MPVSILDLPTRTAVAAATAQQSKCEALIAPWAGGNVTARLFAPDGTTLLRTLTLLPFAINSATPRGVVCGAHIADTHVATGTPGRWVFRSGSTDIFSIDAGVSGASVNHVGAVKTLCVPTLAGVVFTTDASLPVTPATALEVFAASLTPGQTAIFSAPSLSVDVPGIGLPFGGSPAATASPWDWMCYLPRDPISKKIMVAGGRDRAVPNATKLMVFDEKRVGGAGEGYSIVNPFGIGTGHVYNGLCIASEHRQFYFASQYDGRVAITNCDTDAFIGFVPSTVASGVTVYRGGEAAAMQWYPLWGTQGSLVFVARDRDAAGVFFSRFDRAAQAVVQTGWLAGEEGFGIINFVNAPSDGNPCDHPAGCYVPLARAGLYGSSSHVDPKRLLIVRDDGTMDWTAPCPAGVSVLHPGGISAGCVGLMAPHPTRAAAIIICRHNNKIWTYEFASDTFVDRGTAPSDLRGRYQGITVAAEYDALIAITGTGGDAFGNTIVVHKVGSSLG